MDGIGRPLFRRRLGRGKVREECRNWPRDVAVKCSGKASRGVTAFERRQCRKNNVFFFEEHRSRLHYPTFPPDKIGRKFRESIVLAFLQREEKGGGLKRCLARIKAKRETNPRSWPRSWKQPRHGRRYRSEEANRSQARNALLLLGSKADPFERRGVSSIFKQFFVNRIRARDEYFCRFVRYAFSRPRNRQSAARAAKVRILIEKIEEEGKTKKKTRRKSVSININIIVIRVSREIFRLIYVNGKSPILLLEEIGRSKRRKW